MSDFRDIPPDHFLWALLAVFGGVARYLDKYVKGSEKVTVPRMVSSVIVSAFTGWMTAEVMLLMYPNWALVAAGIGGYAGTQLMDQLIDILKYKLNQDTNTPPEQKKDGDQK